MKILFLDIETAPNKAYVWGLWDQNIATNQVEQSSYTLCWSAKWLGDTTMYQDSVRNKRSMKQMLAGAHKLLDEADVVVHYNGFKFDVPTLNKEFLIHGFAPPSPYKQLDLLQVARRAFRFQSNKLSAVTEALGMGSKIKTDFSLWVACMNDDPKAWDKMLRYNAKDVRLLEKLYRQLRPWIERHPNWSAHKQGLACPKCGIENVQARGTQVAQTRTYTRYHCQGCGAWFRGNKSTGRTPELGVNVL